MRITHKTPNVSVTNDDLPAGQMAGSYGWIEVTFLAGWRYAHPTLPPGWVECETDDPSPYVQEFYVHMDHAIWHGAPLPWTLQSLQTEWREDPRVTHEVWANDCIQKRWVHEFAGTREMCLRYLDVVTGASCRLWEFSIRPVKR